jgi:sucrose-6-phosphate hydrolase SacC (GH32 family)
LVSRRPELNWGKGRLILKGSVVVDCKNSSGLCKTTNTQGRSCLIPVYAAAYKDRQKQHVAYSNDLGRTWTN